MAVDRLLDDADHVALLDMVSEISDRELGPCASEFEASSRFPREKIRLLGAAGLLSLPYPAQVGGGGVPYVVYLQALEEIAARWASVALAISVHTLACYPVYAFGSPAQKDAWLPGFLDGTTLGAYCLSESHAGSDPSALATKATRTSTGYVINGSKAWVTHGGHADFYNVFARLDGDPGGVSCFLVRAGTPGLSFAAPERKMGLTGSPTTSVTLDDVSVPAEALIGEPGAGLRIAYRALDSGRLGIATCAVGLGQCALDVAVRYAKGRTQFGVPIIDHQGLAFLLADMAAAVETSRAMTLEAARRRDAGVPFGRQASIAKLVATDSAMAVTTNAVQVLGGYGYTRDFPVERYMREAKIMQIFEGTNQIQRMVIGRSLARQ